MSHLFDPLVLRGVTIRNRVGMSPMCQYSSQDGLADEWHFAHLVSRAVGGVGLIMMEATAVTAEGRISLGDNGIWADAHVDPLRRITAAIKRHGATPGIQLAHAGRKASRDVPWHGDKDLTAIEGRWQVVGPSALPFAPDWQVPKVLSISEIAAHVTAFVRAAERSLAAGFEVIEIHAAHGYLFHSFLSPLANKRDDHYGGSFDGRTRFLLAATNAVRQVWPDHLPLFVRLSCTDWVDGGWTLADSIALSRRLKQAGVDLIDCSTGGIVPNVKIPVGANYQVPCARDIRLHADIATAAVGMITEPMQADAIIRNSEADMAFLARELLRHPYWTFKAAQVLHQADSAAIPPQYLRGFPIP